MKAAKIQLFRFLTLFSLLLGLPLLCAGENGVGAVSSPWADVHKAAAPIRSRLLKRLPKEMPGIRPKALVAFFEENFPDVLLRLDEKCLADEQAAGKFLRSVSKHYLNLETLRKRSPDEYKRVLEIERMESRARMLARDIRRVRMENQERGARSEQPVSRDEQLREVLVRVFDAAQQNQLIEINRLEAEVRECRKMLEQREANRKIIIDTRYLELTGRDWVDEDAARASTASGGN